MLCPGRFILVEFVRDEFLTLNRNRNRNDMDKVLNLLCNKWIAYSCTVRKRYEGILSTCNSWSAEVEVIFDKYNTLFLPQNFAKKYSLIEEFALIRPSLMLRSRTSFALQLA